MQNMSIKGMSVLLLLKKMKPRKASCSRRQRNNLFAVRAFVAFPFFLNGNVHLIAMENAATNPLLSLGTRTSC